MDKEKTFEENLQDLQQIVAHLEQGDVPLEEALKEFQKGVELSNELQSSLKDAEETLAKVMKDNGDEDAFEVNDNDNE
ncbi:exodeoxyribonuclease VII small subunit [Pediococcus claussenii]|uniref:Exodeoxyribonuclease 7 small subunit n=1 Tax=Pediococcus claussenii (strain ATCC BAA-344 / DSM 14800 / JCM 18046 / KCTC 3811 / LMG 21948 / P06) TaxID=701521 RepID=G8PDJ4_PEDCP|nr:exodeoxyribonuclease VII small subunit [Pediococcus claussenii]AEV95329.1 exodeoxyribonuclease VII, small subunit [Pediococcus claussenii ATCC BAA-344]ANZ68861.1 exodeoxyribonuclease VII small subunit [Pediococcus claussenii]ANZ70677.1 exodeoxyribonuclease VII small subunit [Pediococcus claussenii]KRN19489.1 hypothetical protein IV79_GL001206 [Pediococcus claussenii]